MNNVPFQKLRITWFGLKYAFLSGLIRDKNPVLGEIYRGHAMLAESALKAIRLGRQEKFLEELDRMMDRNLDEYIDKELKLMQEGRHEDVPEWLRKDR